MCISFQHFHSLHQYFPLCYQENSFEINALHSPQKSHLHYTTTQACKPSFSLKSDLWFNFSFFYHWICHELWHTWITNIKYALYTKQITHDRRQCWSVTEFGMAAHKLLHGWVHGHKSLACVQICPDFWQYFSHFSTTGITGACWFWNAVVDSCTIN